MAAMATDPAESISIHAPREGSDTGDQYQGDGTY